MSYLFSGIAVAAAFATIIAVWASAYEIGKRVGRRENRIERLRKPPPSDLGSRLLSEVLK